MRRIFKNSPARNSPRAAADKLRHRKVTMEKELKMRTEQKTNIRNSISRLFLVAVSVIIQVVWIVMLFFHLNSYSPYISFVTALVGLAVCLMIYGRRTNGAIKLPWIMLILIWPVVGLCLYTLMGRKNTTKRMRERFEKIDTSLEGLVQQDEMAEKALEKKEHRAANIFRYLKEVPKCPFYQNTKVTFYSEAKDGFEAQLQDLQNAKHYIFMEYYAIEEASAFERLKNVLAAKVREGVEVRLFYDDIGSISFINVDFIRRMEALGIQCRVFNPVVPILNMFMNNRDHRKFTVIDGRIGFTGGYNLADEYFNITHPYGYWKDSGVRLEGEAVQSLIVMFLEMWNAMEWTDKDYTLYFPEKKAVGRISECTERAGETQKTEAVKKENDAEIVKDAYKPEGTKGFVAPYWDSPLDTEHVGENIYMNLLKYAEYEAWFTTPYLMITDELKRELIQAATRGVDVRIITPGIPDKKVIYQVTRSYYEDLAEAGVRIYEYTPGFLHAKQCVVDQKMAVVGTINLDYRSLYLHFEDAVLMYDCDCIGDIRKDIAGILEVSEEVTEKYKELQKKGQKLWQLFLRLLSPLM